MPFKENVRPFIKKFTQGGFFYIYDVNTDQVVEVEKIVYDIIDHCEDEDIFEIENRFRGNYTASQISGIIEEIKKAKKEQGLFSSFRPQKITMGISRPEQVKKMHEEGLKQLLLELTKDCTLNCSYCNTSGKYAGTNSHRDHMSNETCLKAVDFFCQRSSHSKSPFISFYGGEPLLRFDLIKEAVRYIKKNYGPHKYCFNLTTNGSIMDPGKIEFLCEHEFDILVSLDGPENIHDRYRISRSGESSYHRVMKNLELLKQYNSDFFSRKVSISCVLAPPFEIDDILHFFSKQEIFIEMRQKGKIRASVVDVRETTFLEDFGCEENMKQYRFVFDKLVKNLERLILEKSLDKLTIEKNAIYHILINLARRPLKQLYDYLPPFGACHIGLKRLFVTTAGDFYICERVIDQAKIGNVHRGFDYNTITNQYKKFDDALEDCKNCWAINHCERCWALIGKFEEFNGKNKEEFCSSNQRIIEIALKVYTELLRINPDSLKIFANVPFG